MKTLCVDLGGSRVKLALMTADSHPQPDVFEVDSRAPLAQTLSFVAQVTLALMTAACRRMGTARCRVDCTALRGLPWNGHCLQRKIHGCSRF